MHDEQINLNGGGVVGICSYQNKVRVFRCGRERVDLCEEVVKQRKSSVQRGEVNGQIRKPQLCVCRALMCPQEKEFVK